ncbi:hypothetical protein Ple7327_1299 [Pleurocapsa sp. PCC 7327]|uniref:DUF305 domain-containing protein n=1 Tax=Pleurocapsa sp. PCC 7327 TaxID=118163 RepID=UPI00029FED2F|nr:DUF305 domain-containing protein [Pleurocapsa sp. PCC 7327]AFY76693.1 hypothetical protein Ple7327_1299 [Pleurocapsa sp. PCC 7327]
MQLLSMKKSFLALTLVASTALGATLTACSDSNQNASTAQNLPATEADNKQMEHNGSMNHSMEMDLGPADADYDLRFIDAMVLHHQGAVVMAKEVQQKSKRPELKQLADEIIEAQEKEIAQMQQWRNAWYPKAGEQPMAWYSQMGHMMLMSPEQMKAMRMDRDLGKADAEFDLRFLNAMIPHHEGALTMARDALSKSQRPEVKQLAENIITSQQKEIDQMKQWQQAWYRQ